MKPTTDAHGQPHVELSPRLVDRDIDLRAVTYTVAGIVVLTVVAALLMLGLLAWLLGRAEAADPTPPPAVAAAPRELPPGPRLQSSPERDWDRVLAEQEQVLSSYG
ncbi:MAG TPA: hypothetical protein VHM02_01845, partial [Thermoanaerobaculia bacterium]|nr:hypothetical protein [Thermoanaerobaculia bacterium]